MLLPGRASGEAAVPMLEGVPSRHHERTCAANHSVTMGDHLSATLAATVLPDWCTTAPRVTAVGMCAATTVLQRRRHQEDSAERRPKRPSGAMSRGGAAARAHAVPTVTRGCGTCPSQAAARSGTAFHSFEAAVRRPYYSLTEGDGQCTRRRLGASTGKTTTAPASGGCCWTRWSRRLSRRDRDATPVICRV